ncbi:hypothetical protein VT99_11092 [Candidatus Electrothrix marina]|uniref:GAF domain-containing protein n=1 Tax=Candidatus Electrothrix marina TaxID=1859130 RepID=A0A3S3UBZ9_9BACT|nr:hypothetical protein VT99_11092 [Candidatus Electrothrix marina]
MSDFIHVSAIVSVSFVITMLFYLDIFLHTDKKKNWFFVRAVFWLIPALFAKNIIGEDNRDIFYISLLLSLVIFAAATRVWCCIFLNKERNKLFTDDTFTYFDLLHKGYPVFKLDVEKSINKQSIREKRNERGFVKLNKELKYDLPKFIAKIYLAIDSEADAKSYCFTVMQDFTNKFLSSTDARFTLREYNEENNTMKAIWSTDKDRVPGEIPLDRKNMITRAVELDGPAVYSKNKSFHAKGNGNIEKGLYIDYVTACLLKGEDNKPLFSVCLDVKNPKSKNRLLALVDSNVLQVIILAMQSKIQKDIWRSQQ